jgi:predicted RNA-binding protein with RPS1 domain
MAKERVENVNDIVTVGDDVYVKVMKIEEAGADGKSRISLSMKYCSQSDGTDRDPNGIDAETDERKRKPRSSGE